MIGWWTGKDGVKDWFVVFCLLYKSPRKLYTWRYIQMKATRAHIDHFVDVVFITITFFQVRLIHPSIHTIQPPHFVDCMLITVTIFKVREIQTYTQYNHLTLFIRCSLQLLSLRCARVIHTNRQYNHLGSLIVCLLQLLSLSCARSKHTDNTTTTLRWFCVYYNYYL